MSEHDELDRRVAETEAEAAAAEAEVERRRQAVLDEHRRRVQALAEAVADLKARISTASGDATALARRANQVEARHELQRATAGTPRSPFPRMHWLPGRALAVALFSAGVVLSLRFCWVTVPGVVGAWLAGRSRRDAG